MLPKQNKLVKDKDIKLVYKSRYKNFTDKYTIIYRINNKQDSFQILVVVSKKISKLAVQRNRIRRKIQSAILEINKNTQIPNKYSIIILVNNKKIINDRYIEIQNSLDSSIQKIINKKNIKPKA